MNIEIKFRGYSEDLKSFVYGFYQEVEVEGIGYSYIFWQGNTTPIRADSVAQFTGMYDKNGKEIYEGDILFHNLQGKRKVYYPFNENSAIYGMENIENGMKSYLVNSQLYEVVLN